MEWPSVDRSLVALYYSNKQTLLYACIYFPRFPAFKKILKKWSSLNKYSAAQHNLKLRGNSYAHKFQSLCVFRLSPVANRFSLIELVLYILHQSRRIHILCIKIMIMTQRSVQHSPLTQCGHLMNASFHQEGQFVPITLV